MTRQSRAARATRVTAERAHRLIEAVVTPGGARALRTWRPFSLAAFRLVTGLAQDGTVFATVIDVGANAGQFARACLGVWPESTIVAFEPLPGLAEQLTATLGAAGRVEAQAVAIGATDGDTQFFPHPNSLSSSALNVAEPVRAEPWAQELPATTVPLRRLDTALAGRHLARPALLKIDVQGLELDVLAGAPETLRRMDAVLVEAAFDPQYEGQPPFSAVHAALTGEGWSLDRPLDVRRDGGGRAVEADWLYHRASTIT
ncbi:MAG: FkbM family methyltransferase [Acidimicrobiales bacterium]